MKRLSAVPASGFAAVLMSLCALGAQASEPFFNPGMNACDLEWERIKSLPPMRKDEYERTLRRKPSQVVEAPVEMREEDYYYYLARVPYVVGAEDQPSVAQRDEWLSKAAALGHKAANAALMRLRYLGLSDVQRQREGKEPLPLEKPGATRKQYLEAAREAAEAGDPEFATVMMDTARNFNRYLHCQSSDAARVDVTKDGNRRRCDPQYVTAPIEAKKWAEIAARGGNPNAKDLLCRGSQSGAFPELGFKKDASTAFAWCFSTLQSACIAGDRAGLVEDMYERGIGVEKSAEKAKALSELYPPLVKAKRRDSFPLTTR
ncbi:hypothetical protein CLU95_4691 [Variovorax sp. 54]|uniref:sel1 repeat family protein n=1 Tax=Variovorax sp. 54 TaxID=2035212 RepID=UPI000C59A6DD|nr:sel1 repeat family protein [Variovorax sp. 54]PIF77516.1 hypothetical protein CLU95_4691 [Variovorax sp. 54]